MMSPPTRLEQRRHKMSTKTMEYKERQWLGYWARAHGDAEPYDGHEKKLWWRQTFGEEYRAPKPSAAQAPMSALQAESATTAKNA